MADNTPRFGATEFYLVETDPLALREQLRASLAALLGRDVVDSDPHMVLASAFLPYLVQGQASADACAKATLRAYATGQDLTHIADSTCVVGYLDRKPAVGAVLACILQLDVTRDSVTAASDCLIKWHAETTLQNALGDDGVFSGDGEYTFHFALTDGLTKHVAIPIYLRCQTVGPAFNACAVDTQTLTTDEALTGSAVISASEAPTSMTGQTYEVDDVAIAIAGESYGGADEESDDDFAVRVGWQAKALRVPGSLEYFRLALSSLTLLVSAYISPSLDSQGRIVMAWADKPNYLASVNGLTLTDRGDAYNEFLRVVQNALLVEQHVYAYPAKLYDDSALVQVVFKLPAQTSDEASALRNVLAAFRSWRNSVAWHCGAAVRYADAIAAVTAAGAAYAEVQGTLDNSAPLPADTIILASQIWYLYTGIAPADTDPVGGDGEDITPI